MDNVSCSRYQLKVNCLTEWCRYNYHPYLEIRFCSRCRTFSPVRPLKVLLPTLKEQIKYWKREGSHEFQELFITRKYSRQHPPKFQIKNLCSFQIFAAIPDKMLLEFRNKLVTFLLPIKAWRESFIVTCFVFLSKNIFFRST